MSTIYDDLNNTQNVGTGSSVSAAWFDKTRDNVEFLAKPPGCVVKTNAVLPLTSGAAPVVVPFAGADDRDTDAYHSTTTNNSRMVVPAGQGGWYTIGATVFFASSSAFTRFMALRIDGSNQIALFSWNGSASSTYTMAGIELYLNPTQYVEVQVSQDSGSTLNLTSARAWMRMVAVA